MPRTASTWLFILALGGCYDLTVRAQVDGPTTPDAAPPDARPDARPCDAGGDAGDTAGCVNGLFAFCGDGHVRAGVEECDPLHDATCNDQCLKCDPPELGLVNGHRYWSRTDGAWGFLARDRRLGDRPRHQPALPALRDRPLTEVERLAPGSSGLWTR